MTIFDSIEHLLDIVAASNIISKTQTYFCNLGITSIAGEKLLW